MKVVAFAGGVGGARLADGLAGVLAGPDLTVIVNTGDDLEHLGLQISPDLDTVCYTLAGLSNPATGWGRADESWNALESLETLGGPTWFRLGDRDLGVHLERTRRLRSGQALSQVTREFCQAWGVPVQVLPMSDDPLRTWVCTAAGDLPFQEYFVHRQCRPRVTGFRFEGCETARPAPGVLAAIAAADLLLFCPSNPWVSMDPILSLVGIRAALAHKCVLAVSPIIAGQTVKGPAAKMYAELGIQPSAAAVAHHYGASGRPVAIPGSGTASPASRVGLLSGFVLDRQDADQAAVIQQSGMRTLVTDTWMRTAGDRRRLAQEILDFAKVVFQSGENNPL